MGIQGLWGVIKAHPVVSAITAITALIVVVNQASRAAEESAAKSKELITKNKDELSSLDDLVSKYKELAKADRTDSSNREAIKKIQDEIAQLVGAQAENLDLVNGKLKEQLRLLNTIYGTEASETTSEYRRAYDTSVHALKDTQWNDYDNTLLVGKAYRWLRNLGMDGSQGILIKDAFGELTSEDVIPAINEALKKAGLDSDVFGGLDFSLNLPEKIGDRVKALDVAIKVLESFDGYEDNKLWEKLTDIRGELNGLVTNVEASATDLLNNLLDSKYFSDTGQKDISNIDSLDSYLKYRNDIIKELLNDDDIKKSIEQGILNEDFVETQADAYLSGLPEISQYYNEWYNQFGSDVAKSVDNLKTKLQLDVKFFEPENFYNGKNDTIEEWFNSLTDEQKDIIVNIQTKYNNDNVKAQLEQLSEDGNVDLTIRPTVDGSELKKAGWDVDSNSTATVFTSTFSNEDGSIAMNFTPIMTDDKGNYKGTLSPQELEKYANDVISGVREDDLNLKIGATFNGDNAIDQAVKTAEKIHQYQDWFYLKDGGVDNYDFDKWKQAVADYEIPEEDKFHFSDLVATEDFQNSVKDYEDKITKLADALKNLRNGELSESDKIELFENFPELASQADNLDGAIVSLLDNLDANIVEDFNNKLNYMETDDDVAALNNLKDSILNLSSGERQISNVTSEITLLRDSLSNLKNTYNSVTDIMDNYNKNGYYSLENLQSLLELEPEYINALIDENGQINLNSQAYKDYVAAKAKMLVIDQIKSLYEKILAMTAEEAQAYANATAYQAESGSLQDLITTTTQYYLMLAKTKDAESGTTVYAESLQKSFGTVANYAAVYDSWLSSLNSSTNEFTNQTNKATSALENKKKALESQKDALEDYKDALEGAQDDIQSLIDLTIDYIKQTKENEKEALNEQIDALEKQKDALDDQKDAYADSIEKKKEEIELLYEEKKVRDELSDKQKSAAKDALALALANLDDSSAGKKAQKEAQDNYSESKKDLKDYLDEQAKDKRIAELEEEQEKYEEMIENRKAQIDNQVESIESKIDEIDEYLANSRKLYEDACKMIDNDNGTLYSNLWNYTYEYTTKTRAEFDNLWSNAQIAIQKYRGDNQTLIGVMEILQGEIYTTETKIGELDSAIDHTSKMIDSTSTAIDNVSSSLGGLGSAIDDYMAKLRTIEDKKWHFTFDGVEYWVDGHKSKYEAANDILNKYLYPKYGAFAVNNPYSNGGKRVPGKSKDYSLNQFVHDSIKKYASGTKGSKPGISVTQEDGFEAIFGKLQNGQYTMMPQGSQVFNSDMTNNLWNFSSNPQKFMSDAISKMSGFLSAKYGDISDSLGSVTNKVTKFGGDVTFNSTSNYNIHGNVDNTALNKVEKQEKKLYEKFKKQFMSEMLKEKYDT